MKTTSALTTSLCTLLPLAALLAPQQAQAGIPVTITATDGDDEIEIVDGTLSINGEDFDLTQLNNGFDFDVTIDCGDGADRVWVSGIDGTLDKGIDIRIKGGNGEDSIVNYDENRSITANGGGGIDACAENVSASNCETDVNLAALGAEWNYDADSNTFTLWGTNAADQIAIFNVFGIGFYLFNGTNMGLGDILFDFGDDADTFPIDELVVRGRGGNDEIWIMAGSHAQSIEARGGSGSDELILVGSLAADETAILDGGRGSADTCYTGANATLAGSYTTPRCEASGNREYTDFTPGS